MPRGTTFVSEPLLAGRELEFFASSDPACRPTMAKTGPDGALWIVDMYRQIIEHPDYIPRSLHRDIDFRAGAGKGRIYRVLPGDTIPRPIKRLDRLDTAALVASLSSPNGPQRDVAQQLLVERRSREAIPLLERLAVKGNRATCRLQALATLGVMAPVDKAILRSCLRDEHPAVRRHALQIGESELATAPQLQEAVLELVDDRDAQVRLQLACSLGQWQDRRAAHALAHLASRHTEDPFLHAAVLSSATIYVDLVLEEVLAERALDSHHAPLIRDLILMTLDCGEEAAFASALQKVAAPRDGAQASWQLSVVAGLLDGLERRGSSLNDLYEQSGEDLRMAVRSLGHIFQTARRTALDQQAPTAERVQAVRLLGRGRTGRDRDIDDLVSLVTPQSSIAVQEEAIATLGHLSETEGLQRLLTEWDQHLPTIREKILDHVLMRTSWTVCLLEGLETQQISPATIDPRYRFSLLTHRSEEIRNRSREAFQRAIGPDREAVVRSYQTALKREGDVDRGKRIFDRTCAACHESTAANHIGPDLGALQERSAESLLIDTLDPNRAIDPRFIGYVAITKDGRTWTGILASETDNSIALVDPHGVRHVLLRSEIEGLDCTNKSLMPEGLETEIRDPQAMADLLSFLRKQASGRAEDVE